MGREAKKGKTKKKEKKKLRSGMREERAIVGGGANQWAGNGLENTMIMGPTA